MNVQAVITVPCRCIPGESLGDGQNTAEFHRSQHKAAKAVMRYVVNQTRYWAVHLRGAHVVSVVVDGQQYGGSAPG